MDLNPEDKVSTISQIDFYHKDGATVARLEMTTGKAIEFYVDEDAQVYNYQKPIHEPDVKSEWEDTLEKTELQDVPSGDGAQDPISIHVPSWVPSYIVEDIIREMESGPVPVEFFIQRGFS